MKSSAAPGAAPIAAATATVITVVATVTTTVITVITAVATATVITVIATIAAVTVIIAAVVPAVPAIIVVAAVTAATAVVTAISTPASPALRLAALEARRLGCEHICVAGRAGPISWPCIAPPRVTTASLVAGNDYTGTDLTSLVLALMVILGCILAVLSIAVCKEGKTLVAARAVIRELQVFNLSKFSKIFTNVVLVSLERESSQEELAAFLVSVGRA